MAPRIPGVCSDCGRTVNDTGLIGGTGTIGTVTINGAFSVCHHCGGDVHAPDGTFDTSNDTMRLISVSDSVHASDQAIAVRAALERVGLIIRENPDSNELLLQAIRELQAQNESLGHLVDQAARLWNPDRVLSLIALLMTIYFGINPVSTEPPVVPMDPGPSLEQLQEQLEELYMNAPVRLDIPPIDGVLPPEAGAP